MIALSIALRFAEKLTDGAHASCSSLRSTCFLNIIGIDLWGLLASLCRIDDEFERIRVLTLFHQLQVREPLSPLERIAAGKLCLCGFDQLRCHCILSVCSETICCFDNLRLREAQIVNEKFRMIRPAGMSQSVKVRLPVADILIVDSVNHMLAQDVVRLVCIGLSGQEIRGNEV